MNRHERRAREAAARKYERFADDAHGVVEVFFIHEHQLADLIRQGFNDDPRAVAFVHAIAGWLNRRAENQPLCMNPACDAGIRCRRYAATVVGDRGAVRHIEGFGDHHGRLREMRAARHGGIAGDRHRQFEEALAEQRCDAGRWGCAMNAPDNILIDCKEEAQRFLNALDPDAKSFTFQTFDDNKARKKAFDKLHAEWEVKGKKEGKPEPIDPYVDLLHGTLDQCWERLVHLNQIGAGVFITVNETDLKGRKEGNIKRVRAVFSDLDGAPLDPVLEWRKPNIVVESSEGKYHAYWFGTIKRDADAFKKLQKALAAKFDSDSSVCDLPRVMRLPGFLHQKGNPFLTHIIQTNDTVYSIGDIAIDLIEFFEGKAKTPPPPLGHGSRSQQTNDAAMLNFDAWVPQLFPAAEKTSEGGYRVTSAALGRDYEEDLSISPKGIVDWGPADQGDPREGKRTPIELVIEHSGRTPAAAIQWLRNLLGLKDDDGPGPFDTPIMPTDIWGHFEPPELPKGLLPKVIEDFAFTMADTMGADPAGLAISALCVSAAAITDDIKLQMKVFSSGSLKSARLWGALVGDPSSKKSPEIDEAIKPLIKLDLQLRRDYLFALAQYNELSKDEKKERASQCRSGTACRIQPSRRHRSFWKAALMVCCCTRMSCPAGLVAWINTRVATVVLRKIGASGCKPGRVAPVAGIALAARAASCQTSQYR